MNQFQGSGNLGAQPELRYVGQDSKAVCDLRVYFPNYKLVDDKYEEAGGFWMRCTVWGRLAELAAKHLKKGVKVHVGGRVIQQTFTDKDQQERAEMRLQVDSLSIDLGRIDAITYTPPKGRADADSDAEQVEVPA